MIALLLSALLMPLLQASPGDYVILQRVDLVPLEVSVKNGQGAYVTNLRRSNFKVFEDGRERPIQQFANTDEPVTVGLVVDNSGSMAPKRGDVILAGLAFAKASNSKDEFFVVNFNNSVQFGLPPSVPFTDDLQLLRRALYFGQPVGQTALYDAISVALDRLEDGHHDQRTLIVVSDGGDNVSRTRLPDLLKKVEQTRATIYTIGLSDPEDLDANFGVLRKISSVSGGMFYEVQDLSAVLPTMRKIADDIRHRYLIAFTPDERNDSRTRRNVKVIAEEDGHKLRVRARTVFTLDVSGAHVDASDPGRNVHRSGSR